MEFGEKPHHLYPFGAQVGLSLLVDVSGKLMKAKEPCTRKDVEANPRASKLKLPLYSPM